MLRPGAIVTRFKSAEAEFVVLQTWLLAQGISVPWSTTPTMNVPNISRNHWDRKSADRVRITLAARYPQRAVDRR